MIDDAPPRGSQPHSAALLCHLRWRGDDFSGEVALGPTPPHRCDALINRTRVANKLRAAAGCPLTARPYALRAD